MISVVKASGTPWDMGHAIGSQLSRHLRIAAERFDERIAGHLGDKGLKDKVEPYIACTERVAPRTLEEMRGMAEGAGVIFTSLFGLNATQELTYSQGCSSLAMNGDATADGSVILGHNEDNSPFYADHCYVVDGAPDEEPAFLAFAYAGMVLHQGFNDRGIGSVGNALYSNDLRPGVPKLVAYREIMRSEFLEDAIRRCIKPERANGNNHVLASLEGEVYDVEVSATKHSLLYAEDGVMAHTNHFTAAELQHLDAWADLLNSRIRLNRLRKLLYRDRGEITVESVKKALSDHANYPRSICKHVKPSVNEEVSTVGSVIMNLTDRTLQAISGNPCEGSYRQLKMS
ncbi:MAG: C45 family peptidase [Candidatus Bathyarchaeota archaeon]